MSGIIIRVPPYYRNAWKRLFKTPKLYFSDSGLLGHLLGIRSVAELARSPFAGAVFEGFVVSEIVKAQQSVGNEGEVYYFRDEQGLEVDIVLSPREGRAVLAECKLSATATPDMTVPMRRLAVSLGKEVDDIKMYLIHKPTKSARISPTAGENVSVSSVKEFISDVFGP